MSRIPCGLARLRVRSRERCRWPLWRELDRCRMIAPMRLLPRRDALDLPEGPRELGGHVAHFWGTATVRQGCVYRIPGTPHQQWPAPRKTLMGLDAQGG